MFLALSTSDLTSNIACLLSLAANSGSLGFLELLLLCLGSVLGFDCLIQHLYICIGSLATWLPQFLSTLSFVILVVLLSLAMEYHPYSLTTGLFLVSQVLASFCSLNFCHVSTNITPCVCHIHTSYFLFQLLPYSLLSTLSTLFCSPYHILNPLAQHILFSSCNIYTQQGDYLAATFFFFCHPLMFWSQETTDYQEHFLSETIPLPHCFAEV